MSPGFIPYAQVGLLYSVPWETQMCDVVPTHWFTVYIAGMIHIYTYRYGSNQIIVRLKPQESYKLVSWFRGERSNFRLNREGDVVIFTPGCG